MARGVSTKPPSGAPLTTPGRAVLVGEPTVISPGDHLTTPSKLPIGGTVEHHGVAVVDPTRGALRVVASTGRHPRGVREFGLKEFDHEGAGVTVVNDRTLPRRSAVKTSLRSRGQKRYRLFKDNCEHFATEAVTGRATCAQIARDWPLFTRWPIGPVLALMVSTGVWVLGTIEGRRAHRGAPLTPPSEE
jgi:hypothetical protein